MLFQRGVSPEQRTSTFNQLINHTGELLADDVLARKLSPLGVDFAGINEAAFLPHFSGGTTTLPAEYDPNGIAIFPLFGREMRQGIRVDSSLVLPTRNRYQWVEAQLRERASETTTREVDDLDLNLPPKGVFIHMGKDTLRSTLAHVTSGIGYSDGILMTGRPLEMVRGLHANQPASAYTQLHEYVHVGDFESAEELDEKDEDRFHAYTELRAFHATEIILRHLNLMDGEYAHMVDIRGYVDIRSRLPSKLPKSPDKIPDHVVADLSSFVRI